MKEFEMCYHPEMVPAAWNQPKPPPVRMVGPCEHNAGCPVCGWGHGCAPDPCDERREWAAQSLEGLERWEAKNGLGERSITK